MMAFGLIFTATLSTVVQRVATHRPASAGHAFDIFLDSPRRAEPADGRSAGTALDCRPDRPAFRLGSPFIQRGRSGRGSEPAIVPGPATPDRAPAARTL